MHGALFTLFEMLSSGIVILFLSSVVQIIVIMIIYEALWMYPALCEYITEIKYASAPMFMNFKKMNKVQIIVNIQQRCILVDKDFTENVSFGK